MATDWRAEAEAELRRKVSELAIGYKQSQRRLQKEAAKAQGLKTEMAEVLLGAKALGLEIAHPDLGEPVQPDLLLSTPGGGQVVVEAKAPRASQAAAPAQFKDLALTLLAEAHPRPLKAAEVQHEIEAYLGRSFHWKTAGMTLYRLKKEGLVYREGQDWYFIDPTNAADVAKRDAGYVASIDREVADLMG